MNEFTTPQGTRDFVFKECYTRKTLRYQLEEIFANWGYQEIATPMIEYYNTFANADMKEEEMYKILDASGRILTLRPDMTIPLARVAATKFKDAKLPLRFTHCSNIFKVSEELSGNKSERTDCGVELIGVDCESGDLQILACAIDALSIVKDKHYTLEIGDTNFFQLACRDLALSDHQQAQLADLIDRKSLTSLEAYTETLPIDQDMRTFFNRLPWLCGDKEILKEAYDLSFHEDLKAVVKRLSSLCENLKALGCDKEITIDLGKIPRLHYYTGLIFEAFVEGVGISVLSGGRYDQLLQRFGQNLPAVGFAVRLDALLDVVQFDNTKQRICIRYPLDGALEALCKAKELRKEHIVEVVCDNTIDSIIIDKEETSC